MPPLPAATTDEPSVYDFSEFPEKVPLNSLHEPILILYRDFTVVGYASNENKDYLSSEGAHFNGASKPDGRFLLYQPIRSGFLNVTFKSNGSSERECIIRRSAFDGETLASLSALSGSITAEVQAGETYYIIGNAGITITRMEYIPQSF